jgi:SAM-dependent methyltransferase
LAEADPYTNRDHLWWSLSHASPELLEAVEDGWLVPPGRVLDLGCGLGTEAAHLAACGFDAYGVDVSLPALERARLAHARIHLARADVRALPFAHSAFDYLIDRGTFHYLPEADRGPYAGEAARMLRPGGRFLLRACLSSKGVRNDIGPEVVASVFAGWRIVSSQRRDIPSDTRSMQSLVLRLER